MAKTPKEQYAGALADIAEKYDITDRMKTELREFTKAFGESEELENILLNPSVKIDQRRQVIRKLAERAGWSDYFRNFLLVLLDNDRLEIASKIDEEFQLELERRDGKIRTYVESATPLEETQKADIQDALSGITGKEVILETEVDESLLGGVVAQIGSMVYDGSVKTQLENLRGSILEHV